jgi:hypothetical protein
MEIIQSVSPRLLDDIPPIPIRMGEFFQKAVESLLKAKIV